MGIILKNSSCTMVWLLLLCSMPSLSAQKHDYHMLWSGRTPSPGVGNSLITLNFNDGQRVLSTDSINRVFHLSQSNGCISDREGRLQFYTNGCYVVNFENEMIENGDSLNYGDEEWIYRTSCEIGYPWRDIRILPDPGNETGYYILHKRAEYMPRIEQPELIGIGKPASMFTYVDMSYNEGKGKVLEKNEDIFRLYEGRRLISAFINPVKHSNGKDWWVIEMLDTSNVFYSILIDEHGIALKDSTVIGPKFHHFTSASGQSKFSPDGSKFALVSAYNGLYIYDFDRSTGQLSNFKATPILDTVLFMGMEWSASGRYIYTSNGDNLWQYDTYSDDMHESRMLVGVWDGTSNPFATRFGYMQRGPDCRIYMSSFSSTRTIHVINQPDLPGEECDFRQHGLDLMGVSTGSVSMPIFPNFRLDTGPVCDPEITTSVREPVFSPVQQMSLYPNPAREYVSMSLPLVQIGSGTFTLYDMQGRLVYSRYIYSPEQIPLYNVHSGLYIARFVADDGRAFRGKLVIQF
jgi:hypothetical protein